MTEMIYFSLSTIVGVGFGDILPLLPFPRMVAVVEAVVGHFYMAVLIGWLVGMFISEALRGSDTESQSKNVELYGRTPVRPHFRADTWVHPYKIIVVCLQLGL